VSTGEKLERPSAPGPYGPPGVRVVSDSKT